MRGIHDVRGLVLQWYLIIQTLKVFPIEKDVQFIQCTFFLLRNESN